MIVKSEQKLHENFELRYLSGKALDKQLWLLKSYKNEASSEKSVSSAAAKKRKMSTLKVRQSISILFSGKAQSFLK